jgi:hypothetical protein
VHPCRIIAPGQPLKPRGVRPRRLPSDEPIRCCRVGPSYMVPRRHGGSPSESDGRA